MGRTITLDWVQIPLREPFRISNGSVAVKDAIIVSYAADGVTGYGEASPMAGSFYSAETPESTWKALLRLAEGEQVEGEPFARAGFHGALLDHRLRTEGAPLWQYLGGQDRPVPSGVAIGLYDTVEELLERVRRYVSQGYRRVKIKIQPGWDVEPVARIREEFVDLPLMVDANAAYTLADRAVFKELDRFHLMMYEQPLGRHALEEAAELARMVLTPLCADESAETLEALERIIALRAARIVNIKIQRVGGIHVAKSMHDRAQQAGLPCWVGTMPELAVASMEAIHLATLPNFSYPTDVEASGRWYEDDLSEPQIEIGEDGCLRPGDIHICAAKLERYRLKRETLK